MVCNTFIRNFVVQVATVGRLSRRLLLTDLRKGLYEKVGLVGFMNPWSWRCSSGLRTMMVDAGAAGNGGGSITEILPGKEGDSKYSVGGWRSEDGKLSCGFSSFKGKRMSMEDFYDVKTSIVDGKPVSLFGVFDGHGGSRAAEYLKEHLFKNLMNHPEFMTDTKLAISETYQQTDNDFLNTGRETYRDDGSTASTAVMVENHLYVANVGDSRTVVSKSGKAIALSEDHKPNRSDERKRIENAGGIVMWAGTWRVGGVLAMSRAFGNRMLKQYVVAEPEIQDITIDQDIELLVVASDGLWDVIANEDVIALAESEEETEAAAKKLTEAAFARGSCDNITCIVVRFHHNKAETSTLDPSSLQQVDTPHPTSPEVPEHLDTPHPTSPEHIDTQHPTSPEHLDTPHLTSPEHLDIPHLTSPEHLDTPHPTSPEHLDTPHPTSPEHLDTPHPTSPEHLDTPHPTSPKHPETQPSTAS